jgi:hypothetical protein
LRRPKYGGIRTIRVPRNRPEAGLPELLIGTPPVSAFVEPCRTLCLLGEEETGEGHSANANPEPKLSICIAFLFRFRRVEQFRLYRV